MNFIFIIFVIFILILIIYSKKKIIEAYDAGYINTNFEDCAKFCKTTNNCNGFGYDVKNKICYPSQYPIIFIV